MAAKKRRNGKPAATRVEGDTWLASNGKRIIIPQMIPEARRYAAMQPAGKLYVNRFLFQVYGHEATARECQVVAKILDLHGVSRHLKPRDGVKSKSKGRSVPTVTTTETALQREIRQVRESRQTELPFIDVEPEPPSVEEAGRIFAEAVAAGHRIAREDAESSMASAAAEQQEPIEVEMIDLPADPVDLLHDPLAWLRPLEPSFVYVDEQFLAKEDKYPNPVFELKRTV